MPNHGKRFTATLAALGLFAALVAVGAGAVPALATVSNSQASQSPKVFNIVLSNDYVGNQWRLEMQNITKAMADHNTPFKGRVNLSIQVSETSVTSQIQSLDNIIATHPDAILLDSVSPTALNPVIQKACSAGILVVTFDQIATAPCVWKVYPNNVDLFEANATWLAKTIHGKGNVVQDYGLPGQPVSENSDQAVSTVFKKYPQIKIVSTYVGDYSAAASDQAMASILASGKTVNGLYGISGVDGAVEAILNAKANLVPSTNYGDTSPGLLKTVNKYLSKGLQFQFADNPPTQGGYALDVAYRLLTKQNPVSWGLTKSADALLLPVQVYNTNGISSGVPGVKLFSYKVLLKAYGNLPSDAEVPLSIPQCPVTTAEALGG